mmetsp:Transcript_16012/g.34662  ORF Transcript_16012/g.34662 Transcript_16012/m.34662 type:complete len:276 (-) Transcript_16012:218-1045(-)
MDGRVAVVTGANKGIGFEIVRSLGKQMHTVLTARNEELGKAAVAALKDADSSIDVDFQQLAIDDNASVARFAKWLAETHGNNGRDALDVLVNNAAIAFKGADPTPFQEQAEPTMRVNFHATLSITDALVPLLKQSGAVVFVASQMGTSSLHSCSKSLHARWTDPDIQRDNVLELVDEFVSAAKRGEHQSLGWPNSNYGVSKLAVIAMTKVYARELESRGICVTACCPGWCATDMSSHKGPRSAADGATTPVWLSTAAHDEILSGAFYYDRKNVGW